WRLASYQLVHVSWQHVLFNALIQVVFGAPIEVTHGSLALVAVYELGVVFGALACALTDTFDVVVGASGGTYALLGAHLSAIYKDWDRL
ncbi:peptidase S54, rhomboid domain-containing protein, partial [Pelagophyceae sp. CCMP2097]